MILFSIFMQQIGLFFYLICVITKKPAERRTNEMERLVKRAMRKDTESFIQLIEENRQSMLKIAYGFFTEEEDVADVMQQTILNAFEHIGELRRTSYFKTWLLRILINNCNQMYNSKKQTVSEEQIVEYGKMDSYPVDNEFFRILSLLQPNDRVIFYLYFGEEYTTKEISRMLKVKESTIRSRIHRGKEQLRKHLHREEWAL